MTTLQKERFPTDTDGQGTDRALTATALASGVVTPPPRRNAFRRAIETHPFHAAQLASLPALVGWMAAAGGFSLFRQVGASIATGNTTGVLAVFGLAAYGLLATSVVGQIRENIRESDHDHDVDTRIGTFSSAMSQIGQIVVRHATEATDRFNQIEDLLGLLQKAVISLRSVEGHPRKNTPDVWADFAPGSTVYSINGQCRFDVISELRPDGSMKLIPDYGRLMNWVKRYGPNGVGRACKVLFVNDPSDTAPTSVTPQIAYYLTAFRAVKKLADAYHMTIRLDRVRFYMRKSFDARVTFVVGAYAFGGPFAITYSDHSAMFNVPRTLLDDDVYTYYAPETVSKYSQLAEALIVGIPGYSLDELEQRYGHLVPDPDFDPAFVTRNPWVASVTEFETEVVSHNDGHLSIRRRPMH